VREAANAQTEATSAREASLLAKIETAQEIKRVKEAMARQAEKELASLKKLEVTARKAKDAADDLQAVVEGKFARSPKIDSMCPLGLFPDISTFNGFRCQGDGGHREERAGGDQGSSKDP
jgi:hypothetical protein